MVDRAYKYIFILPSISSDLIGLPKFFHVELLIFLLPNPYMLYIKFFHTSKELNIEFVLK
jgi:hypothetical protein